MQLHGRVVRITPVFEITKFMSAIQGFCSPHIDFLFTYSEQGLCFVDVRTK